MNDKIKKEKIFLNAMDSWLSNFIIETFRTDHIPESKLQVEFMGTINDNENYQLPMHFNPHIYYFDYNPAYKSELFSNDIFIYNLNNGNLKEVDYLLKGLKTLRLESEKIIILISNLMTWAKTPNKIKTDNPDEVIFIHPEDAKLEELKRIEEQKRLEEEQKRIEEQKRLEEEQKKLEEENKEQNATNEEQNNNEENKQNDDNNENNNEQENKEQQHINEQTANNSILKEKSANESKLSHISQLKEEKSEETKPIYVYWTEKDYLKRKASTKYIEYKYIENEALLLNQKINIKSYIICPGIIYGY